MTWDGGIIRHSRAGKPTYYIVKMKDGERFFLSTGAHSEGAATVQLRRFEADPGAYSRAGTTRREPLYLTDRLILDFVKHSLEVKKNTQPWVHLQKVHLQEFWKPRLAGVDLRSPPDRDPSPALAVIRRALEGDDVRSKGQRVAVLKRFCSWAIEQGHLGRYEDPTYRTLKSQQSRPKEQATFSVKDFHRVRDSLTNPARAALTVQVGTGMHATELYRFAKEGRIDPLTPGRTGDADDADAILRIPLHKNGKPHHVVVTREVREAAEVLMKHGPFSKERYLRTLRAACRSAGVPVITSRMVRHTVVTYARMKGATLRQAGEFCGHNDPNTTAIYAENAPAKVATIV
jgi:integrase